MRRIFPMNAAACNARAISAAVPTTTIHVFAAPWYSSRTSRIAITVTCLMAFPWARLARRSESSPPSPNLTRVRSRWRLVFRASPVTTRKSSATKNGEQVKAPAWKIRVGMAREYARRRGHAVRQLDSDVTIDEGVQLRFGQRASHAADEEGSALQDQGWNRLDLMQRGHPRVLVDVELDDLELPPPLLRRLIEHRRHRAAGAAPRCPEVDQDRDGAVLDLALPGRIAGGDRVVGKDALLAPATPRIIPQPVAWDAVLGAASGAGVFDAIVVHCACRNHSRGQRKTRTVQFAWKWQRTHPGGGRPRRRTPTQLGKLAAHARRRGKIQEWPCFLLDRCSSIRARSRCAV